jgi:fatty acid desaturase
MNSHTAAIQRSLPPDDTPHERPTTTSNDSRSDRHLGQAELDEFGARLDELRRRTLADIGEADARYIRRIRLAMRACVVAGRALLFFGWFPPTWILGSLLLGLGKILENMELGHNVMHGQYDWMNDPELSGKTYEWDIDGPSDFWRHTHNHVHHAYTNVMGKDDDIGYGLARLFPDQRWKPHYRWQMWWVSIQALLFQYSVAVQDLRLDKYFKGKPLPDFKQKLRAFWHKVARQSAKDYLFFPLLALAAGASFGAVLAGNALANVIRNLWTFTVIFCGHFTEKAAVFPPSILENESRGHWYLRQLQGSSNMTGGPLFHILTGNLSHQIEHHLFPDLPARRYAALSVEVRKLCEEYGQTYNTGTMAGQFATVVRRLWVYRKSNRELGLAASA